MTESLPALIEALRDPKAYGHPVHNVEVLQTHISWVLLAGEFAYKIKKPVRLVFLDFSTLRLRHQYCLAELRLNQRFASDLYLDVVAIGHGPSGLQMQTAFEPIEYAVKMRRFDERCRLDGVCGRGELTQEQLSGLARSLVSFYAAAPVAGEGDCFGERSDIERQALDNFVDPLRVMVDRDAQRRLSRIQDWTLAQCAELSAQFVRRKREGQVRECHGDLHMANMVLLDGQVKVFDCIEFADDLRWIDTASDVAFLLVDLLARSEVGLANWWISEFLTASGDFTALSVLRFYAVYRAMVRLKVASIRSAQTQVADADLETYLSLAEYLIDTKATDLVITHGVSGCGKSWSASRWVSQAAPGLRLRVRADVERKRLFGLSEVARTQSTAGHGIYAQQASERTYERLRELAQLALATGWSVVIDASFIKAVERTRAAELAQCCGVRYQIMAPHAGYAELKDRIERRLREGHDPSEADVAVLNRQLQSMQALSEDERALCLQEMP